MKIGRYEILELIGQGAMGTVYKALDPLIERTVAIKTVALARLKEEGTEFEARFLREAQSAGRLSHPNIVTIYDIGETEDFAYIAMEYLRGTTLRDIMNNGAMPLELVMTTALQIAEALTYAHEHGVVHRDIKPSNIVITLPHGQVKLTDFGIAHLTNSDRTNAGLMLGSPRYMSPEQAMGREITGRSDIFSLGAVLYEMATGEYAFDGESLPSILYRVVNETPVTLSQLRPEISPALETVIMRMINKRAEARLDSRSLSTELHKATQHDGSLGPIPKLDNHVPRIVSLVAFSTPFTVLLLTGLGMIVINYFLTASIGPAQNKPAPPLLSSSDTTILDWGAPSQGDITGPFQLKRPAQTPDFSSSALHPSATSSSKLANDTPHADAYLQGLEKKKIEYEIKKTELLLKYTEHHPDVVLVKRQLKQLEEERQNYLRKRKSGSG